MSEFATVQLQFKDKQAIVECLKAVGFSEVECYDKAENLNGYRGDVREQQAHIIVRRQHVGTASNDLGFRRNADGTYDMIISRYDQGYLKDKISRFRQEYVKRQITSKARYLGFEMHSQTVKGGKMVLRLSR